MSFIYITGGANSGKSRFALEFFSERSDITFIATAVATDQEMEMRIHTHKQQRPYTWDTIEEPVDLIKAVNSTKEEHRGIIVDCLTFWVSNLIYNEKLNHEQILERAEKASNLLRELDKSGIVVTNELGMGIVPPDHESRYFRRVAGEVNQIFAGKSKEAWLIVSGMPLKMK
jgi:adenosylcobinamide kinase/adenosylcobinamide-phosphate guanylyltransferase